MDYRSYKSFPLGLQNNNPGNLRYYGIGWQGEVGSNEGFSVFSSLEKGIRAAILNLRNGCFNKGLNTIYKIIDKWAPKKENPHNENYMNFLVKKTGFSINQSLTFNKETCFKLLKAMFEFEVGSGYINYIPNNLYEIAWNDVYDDDHDLDFDSNSDKQPNYLLVIAFSFLLYKIIT